MAPASHALQVLCNLRMAGRAVSSSAPPAVMSAATGHLLRAWAALWQLRTHKWQRVQRQCCPTFAMVCALGSRCAATCAVARHVSCAACFHLDVCVHCAWHFTQRAVHRK